MNWFLVINNIAVIAGWEFSNFIVRKLKRPYTRKCVMCGSFSASSKDKVLVEGMVASHQKLAHGVIIDEPTM